MPEAFQVYTQHAALNLRSDRQQVRRSQRRFVHSYCPEETWQVWVSTRLSTARPAFPALNTPPAHSRLIAHRRRPAKTLAAVPRVHSPS